MTQMSNEAAEEIIRLCNPIIAGVATGLATGLTLEVTTSFSDDAQTQLELKGDIASLKSEIDTLQSAGKLMGSNQAVTQYIETRQMQIGDLEAQKNALGNEAINFGEAYGIPLAIGATVAVLGVRRAMQKSRLFPNIR